MNTNFTKPKKVAIIGASGAYGKGILARAEEIGVEAVVITRSPYKFKYVKSTTTVVKAQLDEEEKLRHAFAGCGDLVSTDRSRRRPQLERQPARQHEAIVVYLRASNPRRARATNG